VFAPDFRELADAYPPKDRERKALIDFAQALGIPPHTVEALDLWLKNALS
jgi:hypothetical protein